MVERGQGGVSSLFNSNGDGDFIEAPFGMALINLAEARSDIVGLTADLGKYTDILPFAEKFPERFFNVGMAEQNLIAIAAGLSKTGLISYCTTYGVFATRRAYDFIAIACSQSRAKVRIFAALPGLTTSYGSTHQATEDVALMRMVPDLTVIDPCDATETMQVTRAVADVAGSVYVRLLRGKVPVVLDPKDYQFQLGKAKVLRVGGDIGIVSTGIMTGRALAAAKHLERHGISSTVLHMPTIKPFDVEALLDLSGQVDRLVTIENHVRTGGIGSAVAEVLSEHQIVCPLTRLGIPDQFIEFGSVPLLQAKYGLTSEHLVKIIRSLA